jgi:hypothetical protein
MKLRNEQILNVFSGLNVLGNEKFSAKLAWKISTARAVLTPFVESLEKTMSELRLKYAIRDEEGNVVPAVNEEGKSVEGTIQVSRENVPLLNKELTDLLSVETDVENVSLSINDFPETLEISPNALAALQPILHD